MNTTDSNKVFEKNAIEAAIKIGILAAMIITTFRIIQPFFIPVLWGVIIAVAVGPLIGMLTEKAGGRRKTVSILFALLVITILVVPSVMMVGSSVDAVQSVVTSLEDDTLKVPPPPENIKEWPVVGKSINKTWSLFSTNLDAGLKRYNPQLKAGLQALLGKVGGVVKAVFMFIISVVIASVLLIRAERGTATVKRIIRRFAGDRGKDFVVLATATIRGVMQGVIGVAVIQAVLSAIGMIIVGVPAAGLWAGLVLICAIIQLPPIIILGPIAAWVFSFADTTPAVLFLVWAILVSACDGVIKPILMGRGVDAPMLVILIGALGGMMISGIIGLFVGAVVVAIMYTLFMAWVEDEEFNKPAAETDDND